MREPPVSGRPRMDEQDQDKVNRRDFHRDVGGSTGVATTFGADGFRSQSAPKEAPPGFRDQDPIKLYWNKPLNEIVDIDLSRAAPNFRRRGPRAPSDLLLSADEAGGSFLERQQARAARRLSRAHQASEPATPPPPTTRYRGDMIDNPDRSRVNWDRYVGHNIACVAVDVARSSTSISTTTNFSEAQPNCAESAQRGPPALFSLTDIFDSWKTGQPVGGKSKSRLA